MLMNYEAGQGWLAIRKYGHTPLAIPHRLSLSISTAAVECYKVYT